MSPIVEPAHMERARDALERHAWREAFDLLSEADAAGTLDAAGLELLAQAAWWVGRLPDAIAARERAYAAFVKAGDTTMAAVTAGLIGRDNLLRNAYPVANGWLNRAQRMLEDVEEGPPHGWLAAVRSFQAGLAGDFDRSYAFASTAYDIARRFGDRDLEALALSNQGLSLIYRGEIEEGLALADEATVAAVAGEIEPQTAGSVCCSTISACSSLGDWRRASEWTEAQDRWCQRERINGFPGMCRIFRAESKRIRGDWAGAEAEARRASDELEGYVPAAIGIALYEIGTIRLLRGDLPAAEEALLLAHARGRDPEPALSLVRLAQGRVDAASASIRRALEAPPSAPSWATPPASDLNRLALLPAQVEIALAAGDAATARRASDELTALAGRFTSTAARASAATSHGRVLLAEDDPSAAIAALRDAVRLWGEVDAPWEAARARVALAEAHRAEGSADRAALELQAARDAFERLGAVPDLRRADDALATLSLDDGEPARPGRAIRAAGAGVVRTFMFTDIVDSTKLAELVGDESWERLIAWHDAAIRSLVAEHRGEEVKATGDGFFLAFDDASNALDCAVAIQRRFAEQRRTQGFAPAVRIGLHRSEAKRAGLDYLGTGINQASRIAAVAGGGEVLVSAATLATFHAPQAEVGRRTVELKGISAPVEVVSVAWR